MLTKAISRGGEAVNNKLPKQGGECIVIMHAAVVVVVKQNESSARLQNFAHLYNSLRGLTTHGWKRVLAIH